MAPRRRKGRPISGVLLLNKVAGMTSNDALQRAKRLFFAAKAGHTGSLDPLATGVLPLCFGEATKFSQFLLNADKRYRSTFCLGVTTETGDADGEVLKQQSASAITQKQVELALQRFAGDIEQIPSMYSALKHNGQPLYKLARQGIVVDREPRKITIHSIGALSFEAGDQAFVEVEVHCSKGTYIRTLSEDLGKALGVGAHVTQLHRLAAGPFSDEKTVTLEQLAAEREEQQPEVLDHLLLPVDTPAQGFPELVLEDNSAFYFRQGQAVMSPQVYRIAEEGAMVRVFSDAGDFLGVGTVTDDGRIAPRRLVVLG